MSINRRNNFDWLKNTLGPGILFASTAIGVSHLVQSTRAGANYGFGLLIFIIIANLFKYPFFEFASRYSAKLEVRMKDSPVVDLQSMRRQRDAALADLAAAKHQLTQQR